MFWIALAAQLTAATPIDATNWVNDLDWEPLVSTQGGHALNLVRVTVTPDGHPQNCTIAVTSGIPQLDQWTCDRVRQRGKFKPAKWPDGTPAYGVFRKDFVWADLAAFHYARPVDVEVALNRMPAGVHAPVAFSFNFAVDANGRKSSCEPRDRHVNPTLVAIACKQILDSYPAIAARNQAGNPVPSIQSVSVSFVSS